MLLGFRAMPIEAQLAELLKEAMRAKDAQTADCIRMIKTKHMERRTAAGFKGPLDDSLWLDVITAYQKQLRKAREEYAALARLSGGHRLPVDAPELVWLMSDGDGGRRRF